MIYPVLVGINKFTRYPANNLHGCVNDANNWAALLQAHDIATFALLLDEQATESGVKAALEDARAKAIALGQVEAREHIILFIQSSHGTDYQGEDGITHQALCCSDISETGGMIDDVWLRAYVESLPSWVFFVCLTDACHSGDLLRDFDPKRKAKYLPHPDGSKRPRGLSIKRPILYADGQRRGVLIAGCHADQTSADAYIEGAYCGAFSHYAQDSLRKIWSRSYLNLAQGTATGLASGDFGQVPTCEGELEDVSRIWLEI